MARETLALNEIATSFTFPFFSQICDQIKRRVESHFHHRQ